MRVAEEGGRRERAVGLWRCERERAWNFAL